MTDIMQNEIIAKYYDEITSGWSSLSSEARTFWKDEYDYKLAKAVKYIQGWRNEESKIILNEPRIKDYIDYRLRIEKITSDPDFNYYESL